MKISVNEKATEKPKLKDLNTGDVFIFEDEAYDDGKFCTDNVAIVLSDSSYVYLSNGAHLSIGHEQNVILLDAELLVRERGA